MIKVNGSDEIQMDVKEKNLCKEMDRRVSLYALDRLSRVDLECFLSTKQSPSENGTSTISVSVGIVNGLVTREKAVGLSNPKVRRTI